MASRSNLGRMPQSLRKVMQEQYLRGKRAPVETHMKWKIVKGDTVSFAAAALPKTTARGGGASLVWNTRRRGTPRLLALPSSLACVC